jgi:hypothetical protein
MLDISTPELNFCMEYLPESDANGSYPNESERNVHVWCSTVKQCSSRRFANKTTLGLIAGAYYSYYSYLYILGPTQLYRLLCTVAAHFRVL